jgi:Ca-activated chloride channel family protein
VIDFELLRPSLAWWSLLAPLLGLITWWGLQRSRADLARWVVPTRQGRFLSGVSFNRLLTRAWIGALGLAFLALAAAGPLRGFTWRAVLRKGLDIVVCLDTSRSMLAQDLRPSRLERAKREVKGLLDLVRGDRIALVGFSGDARDVAPLTRDKATLENLLTFVTTEDNQMGGTNLAAAIEHGLSLFDGRSGSHEALVLLTDGEDLSGEGAALAEEARKRNIRVYVVGIGTEAGGKIPIVGSDGKETFLRDEEGNEVVTRLDRPSLEALATSTGGAYLSASESPTPLEDLYRARISRLEGRESEGGERRVPYDRYQWPLALGLICLTLELGWGARRRRARSGTLAAGLLPLILATPPQEERPSFDRTLASAVHGHAAGDLVAAEEAAGTLVEGAEALGLTEPQRAHAHFALGVVRATRALQAEPADGPAEEAREADWSAALEAFASARALAGPGELRLDATYDLGAIELARAELLRERIPEISGASPAPPTPAAGPPGAPPGAAPEEPPDPLPLARERYRAARGWYLERLRADWRDTDTRADLELIQRRLHELDRIEEEREEQKDQQQPSEGGEPDPDQQPQDSQDPDQQPEDQASQSSPEEQRPEDSKDEEGQPEGEPEASPEDQPQPQEGAKPEEQPAQPQDAEQQGQPQPVEPQERLLTREEVMQLLDRLAELEKEQQALEAALRGKRRGTVKKDW